MNAGLTAPLHESVPLALVVDSDIDTRSLYALSLQQIFEVEEAEDGADALARALVRPPALIVTELRLPKIDGFALCGLLRNEPATRHTTILVVTGSSVPAHLDRARRAGADEVLLKPADPERVREMARSLVDRANQRRADSTEAQLRIAEQLETGRERLARTEQVKRRMLSRTYGRATTTTPPVPPPVLRCPDCDDPLVYEYSNVGGVSAKYPEQWDSFKCARCGTFQYRHRTRRLRRITEPA